MSWHPVRVRTVEETDLPSSSSWGRSCASSWSPPRRRCADGRPTPAGAALEQRYLEAVARPAPAPGARAVTGPTDDEQVLGMAMLTSVPRTRSSTSPRLHVTHVVVGRPAAQARGGRRAVAAAAAFAEERGIEQLVVSVNPGSREASPLLRPARLRAAGGPPYRAGVGGEAAAGRSGGALRPSPCRAAG